MAAKVQKEGFVLSAPYHAKVVTIWLKSESSDQYH